MKVILKEKADIYSSKGELLCNIPFEGAAIIQKAEYDIFKTSKYYFLSNGKRAVSKNKTGYSHYAVKEGVCCHLSNNRTDEQFLSSLTRIRDDQFIEYIKGFE